MRLTLARKLNLHQYGQYCAKRYAHEVSLLRNDHQMSEALGLCKVCGAELEEYTSKKNNTYMANIGTAIIHFVYNTCCYSWGDLSAAKKIFEANIHVEPIHEENTSDYVKARYVKI